MLLSINVWFNYSSPASPGDLCSIRSSQTLSRMMVKYRAVRSPTTWKRYTICSLLMMNFSLRKQFDSKFHKNNCVSSRWKLWVNEFLEWILQICTLGLARARSFTEIKYATIEACHTFGLSRHGNMVSLIDSFDSGASFVHRRESSLYVKHHWTLWSRSNQKKKMISLDYTGRFVDWTFSYECWFEVLMEINVRYLKFKTSYLTVTSKSQ